MYTHASTENRVQKDYGVSGRVFRPVPRKVANPGTAVSDRSSSLALPLLISTTHHLPSSDTNMAEGVPITNTLFPPPPEYYKAFTPEAVERLAELRSKDEGGEERERLEKEQDPPRTDWILEDGRWMAFGQQYTVSFVVWHALLLPRMEHNLLEAGRARLAMQSARDADSRSRPSNQLLSRPRDTKADLRRARTSRMHETLACQPLCPTQSHKAETVNVRPFRRCCIASCTRSSPLWTC